VNKVFAANWKMHLGPESARAYLRTFLDAYAPRDDRRVLFFPTAVALSAVFDAIAGRGDLSVGAQDIYWVDKGAFTGEVSAPIMREAGARFVLVGHSERRHIFGETEPETARKCAAAERAGMTPMLCVGETLAERDADETAAVVTRQLAAGVVEMSKGAIAGMMIAYEPVWAIGTGRHASPADAGEIQTLLRSVLRGLVREPSEADGVPILYGGSVNQGNCAALLAAPNVDGVLVGGASLDPVGWAALVGT
jgi:triosephosphate isomerase (TIM)